MMSRLVPDDYSHPAMKIQVIAILLFPTLTKKETFACQR
jgi:hypothetical protein